MDTNENLHAGHRERMFDKLNNNADSLSEHELLEILLFYFLPRKNTNEIAHKLLRTFGSIDDVIHADAKALMAIEGVGEKVASSLILFGKINGAVGRKKRIKFYLNNLEDVKKNLSQLFIGERVEKLLFILLDKNYKVVAKSEFTDKQRGSVCADISEIAKLIAMHRQPYAIVAHNHPSNNPEPSAEDDRTTKNISVLCDLHGVKLVDHFIFTDDDLFSYNYSGRLATIKKVADLNKILE